jgi:hypothetical protein
MKKNKHNLYSDVVKKFPHAVWQSFLSIFPHISGGTMTTSQMCCHLPGEMLNSAAECADRALIDRNLVIGEGKFTKVKKIFRHRVS